MVHDALTGVGFWSTAVDAELYGNIIYNNGLDSTDLIRIDPRVSLTVAVTWAKKRSYCLTENVGGKTWSVRGPNPKLVSDTSETKGWFEGDTCK